MVHLTPEIAPEIVAACQAGAQSVATSLSAALGGEFAVTVGETAPYEASEPPAGFNGPGLAILLRFGEVAVVAVLPESTGHLPDWYADPDATGKAKLSTLAQELSMLLVPETLVADEFSAVHVDDLSTALRSARVAAGAVHIPLGFQHKSNPGELTVIWPIAEPAALLAPKEAGTTPDPSTPEQSTASSLDAPDAAGASSTKQTSSPPTFTGNLLKVTVPVTVRLAAHRTPIREIIELGQGSIVKFEKTCDEPLDLCIGDRRIAVGEVVKVGDKFGLRIGELITVSEPTT